MTHQVQQEYCPVLRDKPHEWIPSQWISHSDNFNRRTILKVVVCKYCLKFEKLTYEKPTEK